MQQQEHAQVHSQFSVGEKYKQDSVFVFNDTICLSFQPKRKIFQSESAEKFLRAEKGSTEWDVDRGKLKILSGKNKWRCYMAVHFSSPPRPQWKQTLVLRDSLMLPYSFWREIWWEGVTCTLLASVCGSVWLVIPAACCPTQSLFLLLIS